MKAKESPHPQWATKFREKNTELRKINGKYYLYSVKSEYNKDKKRSVKKTLGILGSITQEQGFIPSDKKLLKDKALEIPNVDIKMYGVYNLFRSLLAEEFESLHEVFNKDIVDVLLSVSMFRWSFQSPIKRMQYLHSHDFCSQEMAISGINDKTISATLKFVGENRDAVVRWMRSRIKPDTTMEQKKSCDFVMMDSTAVTTVSENLFVNAKGYNPNHSFDEQIRLMYIFSAQKKHPVYYKLINGNITDVTSMKQCVEELDIENVVFIADKGFYSKKNVKGLKKHKLHYIIPLYRNNSMIDYSILLKANYKKEIKNFFEYQGRIIWYYEYKKEGEKLITYLDERLRVEEEQDYLIRIKTHPEEYTQEKFFKKIAHFGTLTLINDLPIEHTAAELYEAYKQRNEIEIMFDAYKNVIDADKMYMQNRYVLEGWLTANFIAMIAYYRLFQRLKQAKLLTKYSPKDIVEISKSIFQTKINNKWRRSEITAKITAIFKKIEIEYLN